MDSDSIDAFAHKFLMTGRSLHLLINNAGIMWVPLRCDKRGIESQLVTNYLAQFQLTARLQPLLKKAGGARVVNISSQGHQVAPFDFDDPNYNHREYETLVAYGQSKTAVNLFSLELDNRGKVYNVRTFSLHPGSIQGTELGRDASLDVFKKMGFYDEQGNIIPEVAESLKTIPHGAATTVWTATSPMLEHLGGVYCEDADIAEIQQGQTFSSGVRLYSLDKTDAKRLWKLSEELTGIVFDVD